jgi:hypothetical protein
MAVLTVQDFTLTAAALLVTWNSADSVDTFANNGRVVVLATKGSDSSATTIAIPTPQTMTDAALTVGDMSVAVVKNTTRMIGPFPTATFNSSGVVTLTITNKSLLTLAVLQY